MIVMSDDFKRSVSATEREMKGYVEVSFVSSANKSQFTIDTEPEILSINGTDIPDSGLLDDDRKGKNYASLEQDYFKLDGTFVLPNNDATKNPGMGYVSKYTYGEQQEEIVDVNPFHFTTNATGCSGITIYFQNNVPTDLEITVISNLGSETFNDIDITDNGVASVTFSKRDVTHLYIFVNDMLYTNRRLRIQEIDFGLSALYEREDLISFKTIEQCNRFADEMPINECEVVLGDYEGKFDVNNPNGITQYLGENVLIKPFVGVVTEDNGIEYCTMGTFWLDSWKSDKSSATLTAKDVFNKLNTKDIPSNTHEYLYGAGDNFFDNKSKLWNIDIINEVEDTSHYVIYNYYSYEPNGRVPSIYQNYYDIDLRKDVLQKFAIMMGNTFTSNRNGQIVYIDSLKNNVLKTIDKNSLKENSNVEIKEKNKDLTIDEYTYIVSKSDAGIETLATKEINANGITELQFDLEKTGAIEILYTGNPTIIESNVTAIYPESQSGSHWQVAKTIYIKFNYVGDVTFIVKTNGNEYLENITSNTTQINPNGQSIEIKNNFIARIKTAYVYSEMREHSNALLNYRINNMSDKALSCSFNGDPSIECGDCIQVEKKYSESGETEYNKVWVTKIESEFKGSFNQTIEGDIIE